MSDGRIVSMLPSASEMVCLVGGEEYLVGRSHEDDYPASITKLPIVTGQNTVFTSSADVDRQVSESLAQGNALYTIDAELLQQLKPSVIVTQDLCHVCAIDLQTVERIANRMNPKPKIITLNPMTFTDVIEDILRVGNELGFGENAQAAVKALNNRVQAASSIASHLLETVNKGVRPRVLFVEWTDPVYPGGHWTPQLIHMAGATQPIKPATELVGAGPSARVTNEACVESDPEIIIISPCGLKLPEATREADLIRDLPWFKQMCKPGVRVAIVDGNEMFNRPGPRLVDALEFLVGYIWNREDLIPKGFPYAKYIE
ncbi:hypothetical protein HDU77_003827 [Chytriomyces hyalinus]|nr:hypothetical protein HDU77_003827 [Chytriomyces hyalinus]